MLDKSKTDKELGKKIRRYLTEIGVETPMTKKAVNARELIEKSVQTILQAVGLDLKDDSLKDTPRRMANMYLNELWWGLDYDNFPKIMTVENKMGYDQMVIVRDISINSTCEHHGVPIIGSADVAYIPTEKVIGLSKINRICEFFSRRPQVQERLTEQIFAALSYILETENIAVIIKAEHFCVKARGIQDGESVAITSKRGGVMSKETANNELMMLIKR